MRGMKGCCGGYGPNTAGREGGFALAMEEDAKDGLSVAWRRGGGQAVIWYGKLWERTETKARARLFDCVVPGMQLVAKSRQWLVVVQVVWWGGEFIGGRLSVLRIGRAG